MIIEINEKDLELLTPREKDCLIGLIQLMSYKEIANKLNLSARTIETHIIHIKKKYKCFKKSDILKNRISFKLSNTN